MANDVWHPLTCVPGLEGIYAITQCGKLKRLKRKSVWKYCPEVKEYAYAPRLTKKGYYRYSLGKFRQKKKWFYAHRLVAMQFIPLVDGKNCVNHKDGNKLNNHVSNLEWCTIEENNEHGFTTGLLKRGEVPYSRKPYVRKGRKVGCKPVKNILTGEVFPHAKAAAENGGIKNLKYFWKQLRGVRPNPYPYRYV